MILPFIKDLVKDLEIQKELNKLKENILSEEQAKQEAQNLNAPVDKSFEQSLQTHKQKENDENPDKENEVQALKWKKADKRQ